MKVRAYTLWLALAAVVACGGNNGGNAAKDGGGKDGGDAAAADAASGEGGRADAGRYRSDGGPQTWCGDKKRQKPEQCDDGNNNDEDGCTTLCTYTCRDSSDCDDLNPCNGQESCDIASYMCKPGPTGEDGVVCGDLAVCIGGICHENMCGDGLKLGEEECDDGNLDNDDGCTTDCRWTCVSTDKQRNCAPADKCAAPRTCDDRKHICKVSGDPAADKTLCDYQGVAGGGWCMQGRCVPTNCGDGKVEGSEECDSGKDKNGNSVKCSFDCKIIRCGNKRIDQGEQCDDGNLADLDGCDSKCKVEIVHRLTRMNIVKGTPPSYCRYYDSNDASKGNAFGNAFRGALQLSVIIQGAPDIDVLAMINTYLQQAVDIGATNSLIQTLDMEDSSGRTVDNSIRLGIYSGVPAKALPTNANKQALPAPIDFPYLVEADDVTGDNQPISVIKGRVAEGGLVITMSPTDVDVTSPVGKFTMYQVMSRSVMDVESASVPQPPPTVSNETKVPEYVGIGDPHGILCGAIAVESLDEIGVTVDLAPYCCPDSNVRTAVYTACEGTAVPGVDCDTFLDLIQGGCNFSPLGCGQTGLGALSFPLIYATAPDVDHNGDGVKDAYSVVVEYEGNRAKIAGVEQSK